MDMEIVRTLLTEVAVLLPFITPVFVSVHRITNGQRCLLRSDMLKIYYHNREKEKIHQYEYENFVLLYEAYKALKGNSFIDKIYKEVQSWEIIP